MLEDQMAEKQVGGRGGAHERGEGPQEAWVGGMVLEDQMAETQVEVEWTRGGPLGLWGCQCDRGVRESRRPGSEAWFWRTQKRSSRWGRAKWRLPAAGGGR